MKIFIWSLLIVVTLAFSAAGQESKQAKKILGNDLNDKEMIQKVIFNNMLEHWKARNNSEIKFYFFAVNNGKNPSAKLLAEFKDNKPQINEFTQALIEGDGVPRDAVTKEVGVLFLIGKIQWKGKGVAEVLGRQQLGNMGAFECTYILKRKNREWEIISTETCMVS
jgi:hypothetical protein